MSGVAVSFLEKRDIKKMTAGAGSEGIKTDKGVLDEKMGDEFMDFLDHTDDDDVSSGCSCCKGGVPEYLRKQLVLAFQTMKEATLRPGNLKDLMFGPAFVGRPLRRQRAQAEGKRTEQGLGR